MRSAKTVIFGETIRDWGVVSYRERGIVTEQCGLSLHRSKLGIGIVLRLKHTLFSIPNVWFLEISPRDLSRFVTTLRTHYDAMCNAAGRPERLRGDRRHRIPAAGRLFIKLIYGIESSRLLLDSKDPSADESFDIYGFMTRKSEPRILLANTYVTSNVGYVFSGDALDAALEALSGYVDEQATAQMSIVDRRRGQGQASA